MREPDSVMQRIDSGDAGNLESFLIPRSEMETAIAVIGETTARIRATLPRNAAAITLRVAARTGEVASCFRGVEFAPRNRDGVFFGLGKSFARLNTGSEPRLRKLLHDLDIHRSPLASDSKHRLYRGWPERWLESIVVEDSAKLDALLDPKHFYSPGSRACGGRSRGSGSSWNYAPGPARGDRIESL